MDELKIVNAIGAGIKSLYHYQRYEEAHVVDILKNRRIFCSKLANLNDPWDCKVSFKIDDHESAARSVAAFKQTARPSPRGPDYDRIMDEVLADDPEMLRVVAHRTAEALHADNVKWRRLYCLTPHVGSTLMWSHHAENHKGSVLSLR